MSISLSDMWHMKMLLDITKMYEEYEIAKQEYEIEQRKIEKLQDAGNACADLGNFLLDTFAKINPNQIDSNVLNVMPYVLYKVGSAQGGFFNEEQKRFVDIFYSTSTASITRDVLEKAIRGSGPEIDCIEDAVGITENWTSAFWKKFYKAVLLGNGDETVYSELVIKFTRAVGAFGLLGKEKTHTHMEQAICRAFTDAVYAQVLNFNNYAEDEIDTLGLASITEHYRRLLDLANRIDCEQSSLGDIAKLYLITLCHELVENADTNIGEKAEMLNRAMEIAEIDFEENGYLMMKHFTDRDEIGQLLDRTLREMEIMVINFADMCELPDLAIEFNEECASFLIGIERELVKQYPHAGLGNYANDIMAKQIEIAMEYTR